MFSPKPASEITSVRERRNQESIERIVNAASSREPGYMETVIETGRVTGTIAGAKVHNLHYEIRDRGNGIQLFVNPTCGTKRSAHGTGGHYVNYYANLGQPVTCAKCQA